MLAAVAASVVAYAGTNIDDIFVIMILLAQARAGTKGRLAAGHFLGVGALTLISLLGAVGLQNLPLKYLGVLGVVPIALGIRAWLRYRREQEEEDLTQSDNVSLMGMALITLSNGADNIGVYLPLFTGFTGAERIGAVLVFAGMTVVWVLLANSLAEFPGIKSAVGKYRHVVIPAVFVLLGIYIILDSGLL